jgi:hypothetical protein
MKTRLKTWAMLVAMVGSTTPHDLSLKQLSKLLIRRLAKLFTMVLLALLEYIMAVQGLFLVETAQTLLFLPSHLLVAAKQGLIPLKQVALMADLGEARLFPELPVLVVQEIRLQQHRLKATPAAPILPVHLIMVLAEGAERQAQEA